MSSCRATIHALLEHDPAGRRLARHSRRAFIVLFRHMATTSTSFHPVDRRRRHLPAHASHANDAPRPDHPAGDPPPAARALPDLLGRRRRAAHHSARAARLRRRRRRGASASPAKWPNYSSETIDTAWLAIERLRRAARARPRPSRHPGDVHAVLDARLPRPQDGQGRRRDGHLGRSPPRRPACRWRGFSAARATRSPSASRSASRRSPEALVEKARAALAAGYRKVKIKIEPGHDVAFVRAAREALGPTPT